MTGTRKCGSPGSPHNASGPCTSPDTSPGRALAETVLTGFPSCPLPESARLGKTLRQWREAFRGYFTTSSANKAAPKPTNA